MERAVGISIQRKEAWDKVTGRQSIPMIFLLPMFCPQGFDKHLCPRQIKRIDTSKAMAMRRKAVLTGGDFGADRFLTVPRSPEM